MSHQQKTMFGSRTVMDNGLIISCFSGSEGSLTFLDLPWEDVLFHNILPCLNIQTIFRLRGVNTACRDLIREYFRIQKTLTIAGVAGRLTLSAFAILTNESVNLVHLNLRKCKGLVDRLCIDTNS